MSSDLKTYLAQRCALVDEQLQQSLPAAEVAPSTLHQAMRHSLFAGGKRLRPILCLAAAEACGGSLEDAAPLACAVECLHTYSLIHDDLPAMDDDDFRRGVPTCHKVYGEAIAILAGDAMQALAFELIARAKPSARHGHAAQQDRSPALHQSASWRHERQRQPRANAGPAGLWHGHRPRLSSH